MMKKALILLLFVSALFLLYGLQGKKIDSLASEKERCRNDIETLTSGLRKYKTCDSLNGAHVASLELRLNEYKRFRESDAATIKQLTRRNRRLRAAASVQTIRTDTIRAHVRDTLYMRDSVVIRYSCIDVTDKSLDMHGCADDSGRFVGTIETRDSLMLVETIRYKRFLGFLWRTKRVKDRQLDCISKNPRTIITGIEHIIIAD